MHTANAHSTHFDFGDLAQQWWDPKGPLSTLHIINPIRVNFIKQHIGAASCHAIDLGCGAGILSEALARENHHVTGIDLSPELIAAAKYHAETQSLKINYLSEDIHDYSLRHGSQFDLVTCLELLEHVDDANQIVEASSRLCKSGGTIIFSTLNRNLKAFLLSIVAAEYLFKIIPKHTHQYQQFIKPSELIHACRQQGLSPIELRGLHFNPLTQSAHLTQDSSVNYLLCCRKK